MLAKNSVLESLTLHSPERLDETSLVSWRKTLPFLRDNESLKSLTISFNGDEFEPHVATVCFDTVAMLAGNTTLEYLDIKLVKKNYFLVDLEEGASALDKTR